MEDSNFSNHDRKCLKGLIWSSECTSIHTWEAIGQITRKAESSPPGPPLILRAMRGDSDGKEDKGLVKLV